MTGWIEPAEHHCSRLRKEQLRLNGLPVCKVVTPLTPHKLRRTARILKRQGICRVLAPPGFSFWPLLREQGLLPVDPLPLFRVLAPRAALLLLDPIPPRQRIVLLRGRGQDAAARLIAEQLCPAVGTLVPDLGPGNDALARYLRRRWGAASLPPDSLREPQLSIELSPSPDLPAPARSIIRLWGEPDLAGLRPTVPSLSCPPSADPLSLLTLLWETDRISADKMALRPMPPAKDYP